MTSTWKWKQLYNVSSSLNILSNLLHCTYSIWFYLGLREPPKVMLYPELRYIFWQKTLIPHPTTFVRDQGRFSPTYLQLVTGSPNYALLLDQHATANQIQALDKITMKQSYPFSSREVDTCFSLHQCCRELHDNSFDAVSTTPTLRC